MTPINKLITVIILGLALFLIANWVEAALSKSEGEYIKLGGLSFYTSIDNGTKESKNLSKPIFLYFRSETCYWCIKFEEEALSDKRVIDILNKNFVIVSIDIFKQKNVALNLNVRSTPYMIFFTKDGEEITRIPGYLPKDEFLVKLNDIMERSKDQ
ncbi:MAG: thioredoxin fold domain-containing protein [Candidatus Methanoperedens sp.]|nr:thioredoxin fold domain-containing protein [Candidatus Methanoperedens sp.]